MSYRSDGTPRRNPNAPVAVCAACGRFRDGDEAGTECPECGEDEVEFIDHHEARAVTNGVRI